MHLLTGANFARDICEMFHCVQHDKLRFIDKIYITTIILCILLYQPLRTPIQKQQKQVENDEEEEMDDIILLQTFRVVGQCVGDIKMCAQCQEVILAERKGCITAHSTVSIV